MSFPLAPRKIILGSLDFINISLSLRDYRKFGGTLVLARHKQIEMELGMIDLIYCSDIWLIQRFSVRMMTLISGQKCGLTSSRKSIFE